MSMTSSVGLVCKKCEHFDAIPLSNVLFSNKYWVVTLPRDQRAPGSVSFICKTHEQNSRKLGREAGEDLIKACGIINNIYSELFKTKNIDFAPMSHSGHVAFAMAPHHLHFVEVNNGLTIDRKRAYQQVDLSAEDFDVLRDAIVCRLISRGYVGERNLSLTPATEKILGAVSASERKAAINISIFIVVAVLVALRGVPFSRL